MRRNVIFERARFYRCTQQQGESAEEYIIALHQLADTCEYSVIKDEMICNQLVVGIRDESLPNLTGQPSFSDNERWLFALPPHLGGLGIVDPSVHSAYPFSVSAAITSPLVHIILQQSSTYSVAVTFE